MLRNKPAAANAAWEAVRHFYMGQRGVRLEACFFAGISFAVGWQGAARIFLPSAVAIGRELCYTKT